MGLRGDMFLHRLRQQHSQLSTSHLQHTKAWWYVGQPWPSPVPLRGAGRRPEHRAILRTPHRDGAEGWLRGQGGDTGRQNHVHPKPGVDAEVRVQQCFLHRQQTFQRKWLVTPFVASDAFTS